MLKSMRKSNNHCFYQAYIFVSPGNAPGAITLSKCMDGWKQNTMLTNCLAECAQLTITVSQIERDIGRKSSFFHTPLHSTPPLRGFPSEHRHPVWPAKTRMVWLPDGEKMSKISLFVLAQLTNVTDGRTDRHRVTAYTALMHMHRAVKTGVIIELTASD